MSDRLSRYSIGVLRLTRREQKVVTLVLTLLLVGWGIRTWRAGMGSAEPPAEVNQR